MKKITLLILTILFSISGYTQENFEGATFPPTGWSVFDNGINAPIPVNWSTIATPPIQAAPFTGVKSAYMNKPGNIGASAISNDYLAMPVITVAANMQLKFQTRTMLAIPQPATKYYVKYKLASAGAQNDPTGYVLLPSASWDDTNLVALYDTWEVKTVNIPASLVGQQIYLAFCMEYAQPAASAVGNRWLVDEVNMVTQCFDPALTSLGATPSAVFATLNWAATAGTTQYQIENISQIGGTFTGFPTGTSTTNTYSQTGLTASTCYRYQVRSDCGGGNYGAWVGPFDYCTTVAPPACGGLFMDSGASTAQYSNSENITTVICPTVPGEKVTVTFTAFNTEATWDGLYVYDGSTTTSPQIASANGTGNGPLTTAGSFWGDMTAALPGPFISTSSDGCLTFVFKSDTVVTRDGWVANVTCAPPPTCQQPTNLTSNAVTTTTTATVSWTSPGTATSWQVLAVAAGNPAPTATSTGWVNATTNTNFVITGLTAGTCYDYYVRGDCGAINGLSLWSGPKSFCTIPTCPAPTAPTVTTLTTTATLSWANVVPSVSWQVLALPCLSPAPTAGATGWQAATTNTNFVYTGLTPSTCYDFYVRGVCTTTDISFWSPVAIASTQALPPVCGGQFMDSGASIAQYSNSENITTTICPTIPGEKVTVTFTAFNTEASFDGLYVYNGNSNLSPQIASTNGTGNGPLTTSGAFWGDLTAALPGPFTSTSADGCLTFVFKSDTSVTRDGWVANVTCAPPPTCPAPSAPTVTTLTTTATLSWTSVTPSVSWQVLALPCLSPAPTAGATGWQAATTNTNFVYTGLTPSTCYNFYVRGVCSSTDISFWSPFAIGTTQALPPACGGNFIDNGGTTANYLNSTNEITTICPTIAGELVTVTFTSFNTESNWDGLYVFDGNSITSPQIASTNPPGNGGLTLSGAFWGTTIQTSFTSSSADGCLTFRFISDTSVNNPGWVANVTCGPPPSCRQPNLLTVTSLTQTGATIGWTQLPNPNTTTSNEWQYLILPVGSPAPTATATGWVTTNSLTNLVNGLTSATCFDYYVRSICSTTDSSFWAGPKSFCTLIQNDECTNATLAPVNPDNLCGQIVSGSLVGATGSTPATTCTGNANDDVWFKFVATATTHSISLLNITGFTTMNHVLYSGANCGALTQLYCSGANQSLANNLIIGQTYYVRIYSFSATPQTTTFNVCIGTPPALPSCVTNTPAADGCPQAPPICNLNGYCGNTSATYTPDSWPELATAFCGSLENNSYLSFVAGSTTLALNVWVTNSQNNLGIQIMIFSAATCGSGPVNNLVCVSPINNPTGSTTVTATGLIPGNTYYVMIDGFAGDVCDYVIAATGASGGILTNVVVAATPTTICLGQSANLNATGGNGTYNWTATGSALNTTTGSNVIFTPTTTGTFTVTATCTDGNPLCPQSVSDSKTIIVNPNITPTFITPAPICNGAAAPILPTTSLNGITGTWAPLPVSNSLSGIYTFTPAAGQCASSTTMNFTVLQTCAFGSQASAVWLDNCSQANFFNTVGSGTSIIGPAANVFPNSNLGTYVQNSNSLILRGAEVKTFKTVTANVCSARFNYRIYPSASVPPAFTVLNLPFFDDCSSGTFPTGGPCSTGDQKWQKVLANAGTPAPINLTTYAPGNYILEVFYDVTGDATSATSCSTPTTILIDNGGANFKANFTIQSTPTYSSTNPTTCNGTNGTIIISGLAPTTTYSVSYLDDLAVVGPMNMLTNTLGEIIITGLNAGSYTNISTLINGCVTTSTTPIVLVNPIVVPTFNPVATICSGTVLTALPTTSLNGITGSWSPALNNTTTTTYTFTPATGQCTTTPLTTLTINVNPRPIAGTSSNITICNTSTTTIDLYSIITGEQTGGTWTRTSGTGGNFDAINGTFTPSSTATTSTFTYTIIGTAPCVNASSTATVNINAQPNAGSDDGTSICSSSTAVINLFNLINGEQTGGTWTRTSGTGGSFSAGAATFTPSATATTSTFTYTVIGTAPCTNDTSLATVTITPFADPTFAITPSSTCYGGSVPLLPLTSSNGVSGTWSPAIVSNTLSGTYTFTSSSAQCPGTYVFMFTVNPLPVAPSVGNIVHPTCSTATGSATITSPLNSVTNATNLFISEVTDAETGSLTYVEIYNGTGTTKNLANYKLKVYNNGLSTTSCDLALSGTIANNTVNVIKVSADANVGGVVPNQSFITCGGVNIDDNIKLTTSSDVVIDNWGRIDGVAFTPNNQTGYTYRRLATATAPNSTWNPADWTTTDPEVYTNIGSYTYLTNTYAYNVDGGTYQSGTLFTGLTPGNHTFTVQDTSTGCVSTGTTITINPALLVNTITLTSVTGTDNQVICANTALTPITYTTTGATGATISGLPTGVTGSWTGNVVTINGTPISNFGSPFTYTITLTGGCGTVSTTGTITVNANHTLTLTSLPATTSQTVCVNTAINNITYATTAATGATITGLPNGVTGTWLADVVTISGTPTTSVGSPFNYTVTTTGICGTVTKTGTITVNPDNTITLTSLSSTANQTVCVTSPISTVTYATTGATSATFSGLPVGVSGTWSANVVTITGTPTISVGSPFTYTVTLNGGCGNISSTGIINVNPKITPTFATIAPVCVGSTVNLPMSSNNVPPITGTWNTTVNTTSAGTTNYTFTPNAGQCANNGGLSVTVNALPIVGITGECVAGNYTLDIMPQLSGATYLWKDATNATLSSSSSTQVVNSVGVYTCLVTDSNGCTTTKTFNVVTVLCDIQKGISPNGDGKNDTFDLRGLNVKLLEIYNRLGVKVYGQNNYSDQWGGQTDGGVMLPDGTYYYVIEQGDGTTKTGWVYINKEN